MNSSIDSADNLVSRQVGGNSFDNTTAMSNPRNSQLGSYGGDQYLTFKGAGLFLFGRQYSATLPTTTGPVIRFSDFGSLTTNHLMGAPTVNTASADTINTGSLSSLSMDGFCTTSACAHAFIENDPSIASDDRYYFTENKKLRVISDPTTPANSILTTVFTAASEIYNFTLSRDRTQVFYISSGRLLCHPLTTAGNRSWCNDTQLGPTNGMSLIGKGPNQLTWKDDSTLFVSTFGGEILQYKVPATP